MKEQKQPSKQQSFICEQFTPWGSYHILQKGSNYQVKRLSLLSGQQISLQLHHHRDEHWVLTKGKAEVQVNEKIIYLETNEHIYIPRLSKHRLFNPYGEALELVLVQTGDYLNEDDVVHFDDASEHYS